MNKRDTIIKYYLDNKAMYTYLTGTMYKIPEYQECILDGDYITGAVLGTISTIMLLIKEDIVEKNIVDGKTNHVSRVILSELEKSIDYIAKKDNDGYLIGNRRFDKASTVIAFIRNVFAHGAYEIDYEHKRIIMSDQLGNISLSIDDLALFIMSSTLNKLDASTDDEKVRFKAIGNKVIKNRQKPFYNVRDLENTLSKFSTLEFRAKRKDGKPLFSLASKEFDNAFDNVKSLDDLKLLVMLKDKYKDEYDIEWKFRRITKDNVKEIARDIFPLLPEGTYMDQLNAVGLDMNERFDIDSFEYREIIASSTNLLVLNAIRKSNSVDINTIRNNFSSNMLFYNHNNLVMAAISMFNALFLYGLDDIYKNNLSGLDFSKLDLSKIQVRDNPIDYEKVNKMADEIIARRRSISSNNSKINKQNTHLNNLMALGKVEKIEKVRETLNGLYREKEILEENLNILTDRYMEMRTFYENNQDYLYNMEVITSIRNAIAHGNYRVERRKDNVNEQDSVMNDNNDYADFLDAVIVFDDIYEGKSTFYAEVKLRDFVSMLDESAYVIQKFLNNGEFKKRTLTN